MAFSIKVNGQTIQMPDSLVRDEEFLKRKAKKKKRKLGITNDTLRLFGGGGRGVSVQCRK